MTCIVGIEYEGTVWIGGDSAASSDVDIQRRSGGKVFFNGPFLIGYTSSFRMGNLLQYSFRPPKHESNTTDLKFLNTVFADSVRDLFRSNGYLHEDDNGSDEGGSFLIGYDGHLYGMDMDFAIYQPLLGYTSIGTGDNPALGALFATRHDRNQKHRVLEALRAATEFCTTVRPPFTVLVQEGRSHAR
jgi:ATP-dependent protease HslVU (ClpYQ) peptidase subunit